MNDYGLFNDLVDESTTQKGSPQIAPKSQGYGIFDDIVNETPVEYYQKPSPEEVVDGEISPLAPQTPQKPVFKNFTDLTFGEKAKLSTAKVTKGWYGSSLRAVSGLIESVSTGKDFIKGLVTDSTISEELANDSSFDKNIKSLANLYSEQADVTSDELKATKISLGINPEDTFVDQLLQGTGYLTSFIATGVPTKLATTAIGFGKYAGTIANTLNVASESLMEAQDVYKEAKANGKTDTEAYEASRNTLASNALLIGFSNKISGVFEDTAFKGIKRLFKIGASGTIEGVQEGLQKMVSNYNTDKPLFEGVKESFLIGAALGVPMAIAFDTGTKQGKEEAQKIIDESPATEEQKQAATDVLNGVATEEQKQAIVEEAATNDVFSIPVDETNKEALIEDIKDMVSQGANVGDIVVALQAEGISQNDAENIVAEVISTPEAKAEETVKPETPKNTYTVADLKPDTNYENVGTLLSITQPKTKGKKKGSVKYYFEHADGVKKYYTQKQALELVRKGYKQTKPKVERSVPQVADKAKQHGFDSVQYYFDNTDAPQIVNYYDASKNEDVGYRTSSNLSDFPEHLRSRKLFDEVEPYWYKQTRPEDKGTQASKNRQELYDILSERVDSLSKDYNKRVDERMSQETKDGVEFKTRKTTSSREMAVLDDFKKRYKVQFPTLIVDKIIQGQKTKLSADRTGLAEGVTDGNTIAIAFDAVVNTAKHELIHLTLNNLDQIPELSQFSREDILKAQAEKMGEKFTENKAKDIEEQLALDFEAYQNKTYKPNNNILAKFFSSISKMLNDFRSLIVKTDGDVITQYYDAVLYGKTERTQAVEIATESSIAKYLVDNVVDYTPMYTTRRVLSLSNGIKSIDFKSVEEYGMSHRPTKGVPAFDLTALVDGEQMIPKDMYTQWYGSRGTKSDLESIAVLKKVKGDPEASITIYRASPKNEFNRGDWITLSKTYAEEHAEGNNSKVHSKIVKAKDVFWAMDDVNEFGYYPELSQPKFKDALDKSVELYKESGDLTTKILKDLEGKTTVSKQYILDATNRGDVKQVEKDIIRGLLFFEGDKINVKDFAFKVQQELLPLYVKSSDNIVPNEEQDYNPFTMNNEGGFTPKYEFVNLPTDLRGDVGGYVENIYESPIPTSAGNVHFNYLTKNYFGHTRSEDMAYKNIRRVIEVQSDLYQKGNLQKEETVKAENWMKSLTQEEKDSLTKLANDPKATFWNEFPREQFLKVRPFGLDDKTIFTLSQKGFPSNLSNIKKLEQYTDPTAHFRMIREEIRSATLDGKDVLQFPTGETAMKIEGLGGQNNRWHDLANNSQLITPETLKLGQQISGNPNAREDQIWVITDVLDDGKFKAVPKENWEDFANNGDDLSETFDISGKVDTNNPIYKFYEKEVGRYLKNNYKAETVTDNKGVTWYEVKLKDEYKGAVVAFKERVSRADNEEYIKKMYPKYYAISRAKLAEKTKTIQKEIKYGIRSVAKNLEDKAKELGISIEDSYEMKRFVQEVAISEQYLENNKERIDSILDGSFPFPSDVSRTAFLHTIIENAKDNNNTKMLTKAYNALAEEGTKAGQDIAFINSIYKTYDETSPETYLNKIKAERESMAFRKDWTIKNPFALKEKKEEFIKKRTQRQKAIKNGVKDKTTVKIKELESILDSFMC